jgi:hypothetical protein
MLPRQSNVRDETAPLWALEMKRQLNEIDTALRGSLEKPGLVSRLAAIERVSYGALALGSSLLIALLIDLLKTLLSK